MVQKRVNLVDLVKSFPTNIYLQTLASIQQRTSPVKFAHLAEKSGKGSISNLSTKVKAWPEVVIILRCRHLHTASSRDGRNRSENEGERGVEAVRGIAALHLGDLYAESGQTLQGSFSAVSKPNFASKYSLE